MGVNPSPTGVKHHCKTTSWAALAASLALLGASCGALGRFLIALTLSCVLFGTSSCDSGRSWNDFDSAGDIFVDLKRMFDALATLRIELPPAWELDFYKIAFFALDEKRC